jgi:sugar phosphate isomerase/epimerase
MRCEGTTAISITDVLSIQLYTMRSLGNLDRILDAVAEAGYRLVETVGSHLDDAATTKAKLDARGLKAPSSHVSLAALRDRPEAVIEASRALGVDQLFMPAVPPGQRDMAADGWRALGQELGRISGRLRGQGIELGYHNHHWELERKDGAKTALELIFEGAAGSPLTWQADVAWLVRGGVEPKTWLNRYRS